MEFEQILNLFHTKIMTIFNYPFFFQRYVNKIKPILNISIQKAFLESYIFSQKFSEKYEQKEKEKKTYMLYDTQIFLFFHSLLTSHQQLTFVTIQLIFYALNNT